MDLNLKYIYCAVIIIDLLISVFSFEVQVFGDSISIEEYNSREFCSSKYCIMDSNRLISSVTQNKSIRPCDDFKTYAMGEFLKYRAINDRYPVLSFEIEVQNRFDSKERVLLSKAINDNDPKMFKVIKNYYHKCVTSGCMNETKSFTDLYDGIYFRFSQQ